MNENKFFFVGLKAFIFRADGKFRVTEIWDSRDQLDAFEKRLMPVLDDVGIEFASQPEMLEIHNIVKR